MYQVMAGLRAGSVNPYMRPVSAPQVSQVVAPPPTQVIPPAPAPKKAAAPGKLSGRGRPRLVEAEHVRKKTINGVKRGLPSVSSNVARIMDKYDVDGINNKLAVYQQARSLKKRGFGSSQEVNVLQPPGSVAPTVVPTKPVSDAVIGNVDSAVGYETADMKTLFAQFVSMMNTSKKAVAPSTVAEGLPLDGNVEGGNDNKTPAQPAAAEALKQLPDKENPRPRASLFRR